MLYNLWKSLKKYRKKEGVYLVVTALNVANNFIKRAIEEKESLSPMKLQKLLYFLYAVFYTKTGLQLFSERFATWKYGPVIDTVYQKFRDFGSSSINKYCMNDGIITSVNEEHDIFRQLIDMVWCKFKEKSGIELSKITHEEWTAWYKAYVEHEPFLNDSDILKDGEILINGRG
jgi:uncharacterized phage-associated protein